MNMARPFNPVEDHLEADEGLEISCAVSAPVPSCAMWNLLNNQGEGDMPLLSTADWLKFVVGRSSADYEHAGQTCVVRRCSLDGRYRIEGAGRWSVSSMR